MPVRPKFRLDRPKAVRQFTDREAPKAAFLSALREKEANPDRPKVLVFYGVGGVGKSRLLTALQEILRRDHPETLFGEVDFQVVSHRMDRVALTNLREDFKKRGKVKFPAFDLAFAVVHQKENPHLPLNRETIPFLNEGSDLAQILSLLNPVVGVAGSVVKLVGRGIDELGKKYPNRRFRDLRRLIDMKAHEAATYLPACFAQDLKNFLQKRTPPVTPVVFLDTYEALWEGVKYGNFLSRDEWVRELVAHLPEVLWVVFGRERVRWEEENSEWSDTLEQHLLEELSERDTRDFLVSCGIRDEGLQSVIFKGSRGLPFYLDLCVETHERILADEGRASAPSDFAGTPKKILGRFLRYLGDEEKETLKILSVPRFFGQDLLELLIEKFKTGYPPTHFAEGLGRYSFIIWREGEPPEFEMHPLMREGLREMMGPALRGRVNKFLFDHYDALSSGVETKDLREEHLIAFEEAFHHGKSFMEIGDFCEWFNDRNCPFLNADRWFQRRIDMLLGLMSWQESALGPEHVDLAGTLSLLGQHYEKIDEMDDARQYLERALKIYDKTVDPIRGIARVGEYTSIDYQNKGLSDYIHSATQALNAMGTIHAMIGEYDKAREYFSKYYRIVQERTGPSTEYMASAVATMGAFYLRIGDYVSAKKFLEKSLGIYKKLRGENRFGMHRPLDCMGQVFNALGDYQKSKVNYELSLKIKKEKLLPDDLEIAGTLNNFGILYTDMGEYDKAQDLYEQSLQIKRKNLQSNHRDVLLTLYNLSSLFICRGDEENKKGNYEKAKEYYLRSLKIRKESADSDCDVSVSMRRLGTLHEYLGQYKEAEKYYREALEISNRQDTPVDKIELAHVLNGLGYLYVLEGKPNDALSLLSEAVELERQLESLSESERAHAKESLASALRDLGKFEEAEKLYMESLCVWEREYGEENEAQLETLVNIALLYRKMNRPDKTDQYASRAVVLHEKLLGPEHFRTIRARERLNRK